MCSCPTLRWFWAMFRLRVGPFAMFLSDAVDWAAHKRPYSASPTLPQRSIHDWRDPSNMHPLNSASFRDNALRLRRSTHDCGGGDLSFAAPGLAAKVWASWSSGSWDASTRCTSPIQLAWTAPLSLPHSAGADNILPRFGRGRVSLVKRSFAPLVTGAGPILCAIGTLYTWRRSSRAAVSRPRMPATPKDEATIVVLSQNTRKTTTGGTAPSAPSPAELMGASSHAGTRARTSLLHPRARATAQLTFGLEA